MSSTPRAKPSVPKEAGASPRVSKPAGEKGTKKKKPKGAAPTAPMTLGMPMSKVCAQRALRLSRACLRAVR